MRDPGVIVNTANSPRPKKPLKRAREVLRTHLERVRIFNEQDLAAGHERVYLPYALARKHPNAEREWAWQYVKFNYISI